MKLTTIIKSTKLIFSILVFMCLTSNVGNSQTFSNVIGGLNGPIGIDLDEVNNHLYLVEYNTNLIKWVDLNTSPASLGGSIATVPALSHPEDIVLDMSQNCAYVTTRDNPGTGGLYKVNLATHVASLITFNLGAPQQIAFDKATNSAYVVGYTDGRLRKVDLSTGVKTIIYIGLNNPIGLVITKDKQFAYVSEEGVPQITQIDLTTGVKVREMPIAGLTSPFFMEWTDESENALYVAERSPSNKVVWIDIVSETRQEVFTGLPANPSGLALGNFGSSVFISTNTTIEKGDLSLSTSAPHFMGVGHVPASKIDANGYATTTDDPGYFFQVTNAPFGGTLNMFGNLDYMMSTYGATHYSIQVSKDGGAADSLSNAWKTYKWNNVEEKYKITTVAPVTSTKVYEIPAEYATNPAKWYPPYLIMRWPSGDNGLYEFILSTHTSALGPGTKRDTMYIRVDNSPPVVEIQNIYHMTSPKTDIQPCKIVDSPNINLFSYKITAYDAEGHLYNYNLRALYGNNQIHPVTSDTYSGTPLLWNGVINHTTANDTVDCNCAYTFYISAWGRTINGYNRIQYVKHHKSITINLPILSAFPCY